MRTESSKANRFVLPEATQRTSPNQDSRPSGAEVNLLVIHNISLPPGEYGGHWINDLFENRLDPNAHPYFREIHDLHVSCHLLIRRNGEMIQFVPFDKRAWHAGKSQFEGQTGCNDYSIGIELEGTDTQAYSQAQYSTLARVTRRLMRDFPAITLQRITGHADIAPGRKTDPGPAFNWQHYRQLLEPDA